MCYLNISCVTVEAILSNIYSYWRQLVICNVRHRTYSNSFILSCSNQMILSLSVFLLKREPTWYLSHVLINKVSVNILIPVRTIQWIVVMSGYYSVHFIINFDCFIVLFSVFEMCCKICNHTVNCYIESFLLFLFILCYCGSFSYSQVYVLRSHRQGLMVGCILWYYNIRNGDSDLFDILHSYKLDANFVTIAILLQSST